MEFIVPRKEGGAPIPEYDGEGSFEEKNGITVVCSGEVLEQVIHPTDPSKKIVHYSLSVPTPAPFIGFAVGPFEMIKLSPSQLQEEVMNATDLDENQQQSLMAEINMMSNIYAFALPGSEEVLSISCSFLMHVSLSGKGKVKTI
jgi:transcription initiation factor TFIID subunit 2